MTHYSPLFRILHGCCSQSISNALAQMDLTSAQGHIMGYLARCKEPPCPRDIEETFQLSHPTVSGLLARLEKKDFIELRPDPDDRRCKRVYILPKGWECNGNLYNCIVQNENTIVQGFSPEEQAQFADFLHRAIRNMGGEPHFPHPDNKEESEK